MKNTMKHNPAHLPVATYRLQLHEDFTFSDIDHILDYLQQLGISTIYASPVLDAVPGSNHGYDGIDPGCINPAIGTVEQWRQLMDKLRARNMTWLQDIVPNHLAFHAGNERLTDVMERGAASPYYRYFDINWVHPAPQLHGKLMVPFLGQPLEDCLSAGEFRLLFTHDGYKLAYGEQAYPLSIPAYALLLPAASSGIPFQQLVAKLQTLSEQEHSLTAWKAAKRAVIADFIQQQGGDVPLVEIADTVNGQPALLAQLLSQQYYQWEYWRKTDAVINYRRFFTVNQLITLRMEEQEVFDDYHAVLVQLYKEGLIQGMRIDHIDGLLEPRKYVQRLRELLGPDAYVIAEKILEHNEQLPGDWALQGTSGYDFLAMVSQLLTDDAGAMKLLRFYRCLSTVPVAYERLVREQKQLILAQHMGGEWENLVADCYTLGLAGADHDRATLKAAIGLLLVCMPVYRAYPEQLPLSAADEAVLQAALEAAIKLEPSLSPMLQELFTWWDAGSADQDKVERGLQLLKRLMQYSGPLMAKGVEDTAFYQYHALLSHNEVGDTPVVNGRLSAADYHQEMQLRQARWPHTMNATATHDTKRGEDARLRLNALTLLPDKWIQQVQAWHTMNALYQVKAGDEGVPGLQEEYFIYQSLIGGFPVDGVADETYIERFCAYLVKALREGKLRSSWGDPAVDYEEACTTFVRQILSSRHGFVASLQAFLALLQPLAMQLTLSQVLLKITAPGVPDIYQGCELWDLSYVDPDNRRPVDYATRQSYLSALVTREQEGMPAVLEYVAAHRALGMEKLYVTWKALQFRRRQAGLFADGSYLPLEVSGASLIAYARQLEAAWCLVVASLPGEGLSAGKLADQWLTLPVDAPEEWQDVFTGVIVKAADGRLPLTLLHTFPVALLYPAGDGVL